MKKLLVILTCLLGIALYASANAIDAKQAASYIVPITSVCNTRTYTSQEALSLVTPMRSVNSTSFMSSGSRYCSLANEIGSGVASGSRRGPRLAPPGINNDNPTIVEDNFNNPQYGPVGDALIPLLLMAVLYTFVRRLRRRKVS